MMASSLTDLSPSDRTDLVNLILQYLNDGIILEHVNAPPEVHTPDPIFFTWHQTYIQPLDSYISSQSSGKLDGLPYFDISQPIPAEFLGVVKDQDDGTPWRDEDGNVIGHEMNPG